MILLVGLDVTCSRSKLQGLKILYPGLTGALPDGSTWLRVYNQHATISVSQDHD